MEVLQRRIRVAFVAASLGFAGALHELRAQAPRGAADAEIGEAKVHVDFGVATWDEKQRAPLEALAPGATWAFGAGERTTLVVSEGAIRLGDLVIDEGTFGFAARRTADKGWAFWVDDGGDALVPAAKAGLDPKAAVAKRLALAFAEANGARSLELRYGPYVLRAPVVPVEVKESEVELGGERANARWYSVAKADAPRQGTWSRAGTTQPFYVNDVDASFDVEMKLTSSGAVLRFSNKARERLMRKSADLERRAAAAAKAAESATPPPPSPPPKEGEESPEPENFDAQRAALQEEMKAVAGAPAPFEVAVTLAPVNTPTARVGAELMSRGPQIVLVVDGGDRAGEAAFDETKLLPAKDGARR
jgi:hypothetical protein